MNVRDISGSNIGRHMENWAREFTARRAWGEEFDPARHSFYSHSALRQFTQVVLTGRFVDHYYMSTFETIEQSVALHRLTATRDPGFHLAAIELARRYGLIKDQVLLGAVVRVDPRLHDVRAHSFEAHVDLLATFPPTQLLKKFIEPIRRKTLGYGMGRHVKRLVNAILDRWLREGRLRYYTAKYPTAMRDIIRMTHYPLPDDYARVLFNKPGEVRDDYLNAFLAFKELVAEKRYRDAAAVALDYRLPYEALRRYIPRRHRGDPDVARAFVELATANTLALQARSMLDSGIPAHMLAEKIERLRVDAPVTSFTLLRAALALLDAAGDPEHSGYAEVARALGEAYARKVARTWEEAVQIPGFDIPERIILVLDASGSMEPLFRQVLAIVAPLSVRAKQLILFSDRAGEEPVEYLKSLDGIRRLLDIMATEYSHATNIADGLRAVSAEPGDAVLLVTDEQANVNTRAATEAEIIRSMTRSGVKVIIHNPETYPAHISSPLDAVTYTYGLDAESIIAALRIQALRDLGDEETRRIVLRAVEAYS